jgi:hypothetical protein
MKKSYRINKSERPFYLTTIVFVLIIGLWFFPGSFGLLSKDYPIKDFRSDLKDLATLFYIVITLWLVLVTRKMAEVSLKAQKATNRPELICELFLSDEEPSVTHFNGIKNIEIRSTSESNYTYSQLGACLFLIIKNRYGGGKSINVQIHTSLEANNPDRIALDRKMSIDYLSEGDCVCFYLYRFEKPSNENCKLSLKNCSLLFTTPFGEASKDSLMKIDYSNHNKILITGNHKGAIQLGTGIRENSYESNL